LFKNDDPSAVIFHKKEGIASSAYAGNHGLGRGGMRNSGWGHSRDTLGSLRRISLPGG
jgi:hypothetical protein